jgi:uncharacterized glyoxalase superfamily protein PhnB
MPPRQRPASTVMPCLKYRDAPAALQWLERAFGLKTRMAVPGEGNAIAHAEMTFADRGDQGMMMLGSRRKPEKSDPWSTAPFGIYVVVKDIDAHYARAKAAGAEIVVALHDTAYGSRDYSVRDPEGHLWSFGTYQPFDGVPEKK